MNKKMQRLALREDALSWGKRPAGLAGAGFAAEQIGEPEQAEAASRHSEEFAAAARRNGWGPGSDRGGAGASVFSWFRQFAKPTVYPIRRVNPADRAARRARQALD